MVFWYSVGLVIIAGVMQVRLNLNILMVLCCNSQQCNGDETNTVLEESVGEWLLRGNSFTTNYFE